MAVSSLNSDYGIAWGGLFKPSQVSVNTSKDSGFKLALAKSIAEPDEPVVTTASLNSAKSEEASSEDVSSSVDADTAYRQSLLDPNKLPEGLKWGDGTCGSDVISKPVFRMTEAGNIDRIDFLADGSQHLTLIPNTQGGWRKVDRNDSVVGNTYHRQVSAYEVRISFARGNNEGPASYVEGQFDSSLNSMLQKTETYFTDKWQKEE